MLRPYRQSSRHQRREAPSLTPTRQWKSRRRLVVIALPLLAFLGFATNLNPDHYLRRPNGLRQLALQCITNIYALNEQMAYDLPRPPSDANPNEIPSSVAICREWIRRGADGYDEALFIQESASNCLDWTSPHYRILEIVASSILDRFNGRSRYRHDCFRSRTWDEAVTGVDRTTVQQLLPIARVEPDQELLTTGADQIKEQCKIFLLNYDKSHEKNRVKPYAVHHGLAFPEGGFGVYNYTEATEPGARGSKILLPEEPEIPNVAPLTLVYKQVRQRLGYVAKIMSNVTNAPPSESQSGVVIYIDPSSTGIAPSVYQSYIPTTATSITILTLPLCASAYLPTGQPCASYAAEVELHLRGVYTSLTNSGYKGSHGIQWQMAASTAGAFSRMIMAKKLICAPRSPNCLFPAMAKLKDAQLGIDTDAVVLEQSNWGKAVEFFQLLGHGRNRTVVERLPDSDIPADAAAPAPQDLPTLTASNGEAVAEEFTQINEPHNEEGYLQGEEPAAPITQLEASTLSDSQVMADIAPAQLPDNSVNPNIKPADVEDAPSLSYVEAAKAANQPININYSQPNTTKRATDELGLDIDLDIAAEALTPTRYAEQLAQREMSQNRIIQDSQAAKALQYSEVKEGEFPPSMEMQIFCPEVTPDGYAVQYQDGGTVKIDKGDELIISDGAGTVILDGTKPVTEEVLQMPRDPNDKQQPYTEIFDPVQNKTLYINGTNITVNTWYGATRRDPVGVLLVDNVTNPNDLKATLVTEGASGSLTEKNDQQKKYTGSVIATGPQRTEVGTVIRHGRGYAIREDVEPGTRRTIYGPWNSFYESGSHSSSLSGGSGYQGTYSRHGVAGSTYPIESSDEFGYRTSDSRDQGYDVPGPYSYRNLKQQEGRQHRRARQVEIKIPTEEFKFGNPDDLQRICHKYKDRVEDASTARKRRKLKRREARRQQEQQQRQAQQEPQNVEAAAAGQPAAAEVSAPPRRHLQ